MREGDVDDLLDPFPNKALVVIMELPVGRAVGGLVELAFVALPKGAVIPPVPLTVGGWEFVDPVGADELPDPRPEGVAMLGTLAVGMRLVTGGLVELPAAAVLANNDRRIPA